MSESSGTGGANLWGCALGVVFMVLGFVQWLAAIDGLQLSLGIPWLLAVVISLFLAYIPIVGMILGVWAATTAWGWNVWFAIAIFNVPLLLGLVVITAAGAGTGVANLTRFVRRKDVRS